MQLSVFEFDMWTLYPKVSNYKTFNFFYPIFNHLSYIKKLLKHC
jgi:hypothetical protein